MTVSNKKEEKAVSASLIKKKLLEVARSSKSSISELACKYLGVMKKDGGNDSSEILRLRQATIGAKWRWI